LFVWLNDQEAGHETPDRAMIRDDGRCVENRFEPESKEIRGVTLAMRVIRSLLFTSVFLVALMTVGPGQARAQAVAFNPSVGSIPDGVSLNVTPVVSADRRYVRLSLGAQFQTINGFTNFPVPAAIGGGGNGGGGLGRLGGGGLGGLGGGGGLAGGGLRSVGLGPADFAYWYPGLGVPLDDRPVPIKPLRPTTSRSRKPLPDPVIVPIKKTKGKS
jgi:hypothetical protein